MMDNSPTSMPIPGLKRSESRGCKSQSPEPQSSESQIRPHPPPGLDGKRKLTPAPNSPSRSKKGRKSGSPAGSAGGSLEDVPSHSGSKSSSPSSTRIGSILASLEDVPSHLDQKPSSPSAKDLETPHRATTPDSLNSTSAVVSDLSEISELPEDDDEAVLSAPEDDISSVCDDEPLEPLPKAPVYDQSLQRGLGDVRKQLSRLAEMMQFPGHIIDPGSTLIELRPEAEELSKFKYPESCTVGFIGNSGEGKSSVINSLLNKMNLSRASGSGVACTSVVTEFRYVDDSHPGPYTIEALFMSPTEITELLEELLRSFRVYCCQSSFSELSSIEEQEKLRNASSRAEETLESLFQSQPGWNREFLADETEGAEAVILAQLKEWAHNAVSLRPGGQDSLVYTVTAKNLQRCTIELDYLAADCHEDGQPALWPFIRLIRVYLKSPILQHGLVIADLPGFGDMNYARVRATDKYLSHNCDEVFLVSNIARCLSDESLLGIMRRCKNKPQHIAISPEEEARSKKKSYVTKLRSMAAKLKKANFQLNKLRIHTQNTPVGSERNSEVVELIDEIESLEMKRTRIMISTRNTRVKGTLRNKYPGIGVFCVSNTLYATYRTNEQRLANDYIALSEVRELREHCQMVPAAAQLRMIEAYLNNQVPAFLGSLRQWTLAGADPVTEERAAALREAIFQVEATILKEIVSTHGCIERTKRELADLFEEKVLRLIWQSDIAWTEKCITLSEEWGTWFHSTYGAFCRHNGTWKGASVGSHCWNEELIAQTQGQLGPQLNSLRQWLESRTEILISATSDVFERVLAVLRRHESHAPQSLRNLFSCMERRKRNINDEIARHLGQMIQSIESTSRDMIDGHDSSLIADLMRPAYLKCSGKGSTKLRKEALHDHIKDSRLFIQYHNLAKAAYFATVDENFDALLSSLTAQVKKVTRDLSMVVAAEGEVHEAKRKPTLALEVKKGVESAQEVLDRAQFDLQLAMGIKRS
ncbi:uncharacterized protein N7484_001117 [Penicillium longicatenatum]|uniref:uncharacterized protein n=1 Tax=Penicillium longicatenatum TaxID=1561947 RepID=UPI0025477023|nr:uncharacterized protein N7484_001117 [Penicillium longicatenatum]KAJ5657468.1 hypothetical protein N7484_001117 [Penicillium longicatenatum]